MKKAIVTGATSFIGSHIVNELIKHDYEVIAVVRPSSEKVNMLPKSRKLKIIYLDINNIEALTRKIDCNDKYDVFYHFAWEGVRAPHRDDAALQERNYLATVKSMKAAIELGCKKYIGSGSQAEYGKCIGKIDENYCSNPITEYGKYKLKSYITLKEIAEDKNIDFIWTRIFSVYGIFDYEGTLIMSSINKMLKNESIDLSICTQNWDYLYVDDLARIFYYLGKNNCDTGIYNVASGVSKPLKEFVFDIRETLNSKSTLNFGAIKLSEENIVSFEPVVDKLNNNLNLTSHTDFCVGIKKIVDYKIQKENLL